MNMKAALGWVT